MKTATWVNNITAKVNAFGVLGNAHNFGEEQADASGYTWYQTGSGASDPIGAIQNQPQWLPTVPSVTAIPIVSPVFIPAFQVGPIQIKLDGDEETISLDDQEKLKELAAKELQREPSDEEVDALRQEIYKKTMGGLALEREI